MANKIAKKNNRGRKTKVKTKVKTKTEIFFNKKIKKSNLLKAGESFFDKLLTNIKSKTTTLEVVYLLSFLTALFLFYCVINGLFLLSVIPLLLIYFWRSIKNKAILDKKYADKLMRLRVIIFNFLEDGFFFIGLIIYWHTSNSFLSIVIALLLFIVHFLNVYLSLLCEVLKVKKIKFLDPSSFFWLLFAIGAFFNLLWLTMLVFLFISSYQFAMVFKEMSISLKTEIKNKKPDKKNNKKTKQKNLKQGNKKNG